MLFYPGEEFSRRSIAEASKFNTESELSMHPRNIPQTIFLRIHRPQTPPRFASCNYVMPQAQSSAKSSDLGTGFE